ncbi:hypothetical protein PVK06_042842 [Gossypium arboreum]|uniref:Uncharacterized protein n=1 Tax=Gossypium arboreum TaxID=29729 RepID=A0ABR0MNX8_GOSAR|nr:hypothetical protein PVK06_042842 [Gossypium arboreum]
MTKGLQRLVRPTEQFEKTTPELEFSHKWLEGKHAVNEPKEVSDLEFKKAKKKEIGDQGVPTAASIHSIPKGLKVKTIADLRASIEFNQRHYVSCELKLKLSKTWLTKRQPC